MSKWIKANNNPVDIRRRFNVDATLYNVVWRRIDFETTCVYREKNQNHEVNMICYLKCDDFCPKVEKKVACIILKFRTS